MRAATDGTIGRRADKREQTRKRNRPLGAHWSPLGPLQHESRSNELSRLFGSSQLGSLLLPKAAAVCQSSDFYAPPRSWDSLLGQTLCGHSRAEKKQREEVPCFVTCSNPLVVCRAYVCVCRKSADVFISLSFATPLIPSLGRYLPQSFVEKYLWKILEKSAQKKLRESGSFSLSGSSLEVGGRQID